jgi:hypothetical protein
MLDVLAFWYQVIIASEPLLREAIAHLSDEGFDGDLKAFYKKHLEDEMHHAEWLKEDLGDYPINLHMTAAALAGTQYYLIRHVHPVCLMGYMQFLEGQQIDAGFVEEVERLHGKQAARTLRIHAEADPEHSKELKQFSIPEEYVKLVEISKKQTAIFLSNL